MCCDDGDMVEVDWPARYKIRHFFLFLVLCEGILGARGIGTVLSMVIGRHWLMGCLFTTE